MKRVSRTCRSGTRPCRRPGKPYGPALPKWKLGSRRQRSLSRRDNGPVMIGNYAVVRVSLSVVIGPRRGPSRPGAVSRLPIGSSGPALTSACTRDLSARAAHLASLAANTSIPRMRAFVRSLVTIAKAADRQSATITSVLIARWRRSQIFDRSMAPTSGKRVRRKLGRFTLRPRVR